MVEGELYKRIRGFELGTTENQSKTKLNFIKCT